MSDTLLIILIVLAALAILFAYYFLKKRKKVKKDKTPKPKKEKKTKVKKEKKNRNEDEDKFKGSYVDTVSKYLFRKELKLLILVNRILPKGFIVFPKVGVDLILVPVGNRTLYDSIHGKYIDMVIFEERTMKPKVVIDVYDGTIGDEQLDIESPEVIRAIETALIPMVTFRLKAEYTEEEIKTPILKALGITEEKVE